MEGQNEFHASDLGLYSTLQRRYSVIPVLTPSVVIKHGKSETRSALPTYKKDFIL